MKQLLRLLVAASFGIKCAQSSGVVSILITRISNSAGEDYSGRCCDATSSAKSSCDPDDQCDTYFSACVSTFTSAENECHFGSTRTPVLGGNSFENAGLDKHFVMKIPFKKAWMIGYRLDLEAWDEDVDGNDTLIERQSDKNYVTPTAQWIRREHSGSNALIEYKFKVECDANYYGPECAVNCAPRDDYHGHYTCSSKGERICRPSWHGVYCTEPICASGCHSEHGYCEVAGECLCRPGWGGENCDQCVVKKGCVHGTCERPFECNCLDYWGGEDCSINLNICGDGPCQNGAKCENQYGNFSCTCLPGFSGKHCENADHACAIAPCLNGGKCTGGKDDYECECKNGFYGKNCEIEIDECLNSPCANGARCTNLQGDFECHCTPGWMGKTCQIDIDECKQPASCLNAKGCINTVGDYMCVCQDGWTGKRCDQNVDECDASSRPNPCHNGGICLDTMGSFMCSCREGYEGDLCEREIDECALNDPCQNGGECIDQINGYKCRCPAGFSGRHCEVPMGFCSRSPCLNGGVCFNVDADYECACPDEFDGKNCEKVRDQCTEPNTQCKVLNACQTEISTATRSGNQKRIESSPVCGLHGTCLASTMSDRQCRCAPGFTGQYCHINIDDCAAQPCKNGGTCIDGIDSYRCACLPGWGGSQCQQRLDTCQVSSPCANGAKCRPAHMDDYHCTCRPGWFGKKCNQRKKDGHCASNPCKSGPGVKCIETKRGNGFTCQCPPDRTGSLCQYVKLTICSRHNPCGLHGRCESLSFDGSDAFQCHCKPGWTGERCEIEIDHCSPNPCFNDAECISQDNHYECRCKPGFEGPECRHNIDECRSNPCAIGAKCIDGVDSFECKCPPGRTGHLCEQLIDFPSQRSCSYKGDLFVHSYEWSDYCNACSCSDGEVACTQIDCGAVECAKYDSGGCGPGQRCVSIDKPSSDNCVSASCSERFFCLPDDKAPLIDSQCSVELTQSQQAKINLQFHVEKISQLSQGVHSADVCNALRYLSVLKNYATGQEVKITCCSNAIGTVVVTIHHDNADDVAREIRRTVIDRPGEQSISDLKDRTILGSIYDVDIIRPGGESSRVWIAIAVLMAVLVVLILILGAFIVRYKTRGFSNNNDDSNYTLGSSSGCTDQLVMTSSPSTADHLRSSGSEIEAADQFIWLSGSISRSIVHHPPQKPTPMIFQNQRFSHLLRDSKSTQHLHHHQQHHQQSPPPSYDESSRYYSTIQPSSMFNNNNS